ncbi:MAG TPA: hypothetical protein VF319_09990 [Caldimonas sp.]
MDLKPSHIDDKLNFAVVAVAAVLAFGMQVAVQSGYSLDRGSAQARAEENKSASRVAEAASEAAKPKDLRLAMHRP